MGQYGRAAIRAVELYTSGIVGSPVEAWERATSEFYGRGTASQKKGCPRNAFLGLCEEGLVRGIPAGRYTRSRKNKQYAVDAVRIQHTPGLADSPGDLWHAVTGAERKVHNQQMIVVAALWNHELITRED